MHVISTSSVVDRIALLTSDAGFISTILKLKATNFIIFIPEDKPGVIHKYTTQGLEVVKLETLRKDPGSRVRAILHGDGSGSVQLEDPFWPAAGGGDAPQVEMVRGFLADLGYGQDQLSLVPACSKFWFANSLGKLTVFPGFIPILAVHDLIARSSKTTHSWAPFSGDLAFVLPISPLGGNSKCKFQTYGSRTARSVFKGGGPMMLKDSKDLTLRLLKTLGYLDDDLKVDEYEALFIFANATHNKKSLRQLELLPDPSDRSQDVKEKLRAAVMSPACPGQWQICEEDGDALVARIQQILWNERLIAKSKHGCTRQEIMKPMEAYVKRYDLISMKSFNALACQIQHHSDRSPDKRSILHFEG
ncbi:Phosphopantothenate--cysteine ligase 1 [Durusdinium trenchii]|uniref:Phosphopantothenate--cysteine ligase 1 n=1 Tax=Durusdinium trenchii TaxID=1381693 RepID=A0ABP0R8D7_9DINO